MDNQNFPSLPSRQAIFTHLPVQSSIDMDKILKKMEEEGEKTCSSFESFKTEMFERDSENKRRIDVLNEQLEINERKTRDIQTTIKSLEEKFKVQKQTVQYTQNKADSTEGKFDNY
jgi:outer membrane PBP1 activator LpoA protein